MDQNDFRALCRSASVLLHCDDPDALGNTNTINIDDIRIGLFFDENLAPDRILCYIDIGKLPVLGREEILERVLALNLLTATKTAGVYGCDPQSNTLIFVQHFLFPDLMTGEDLYRILRGYADHANSLRHNLLDPENLAPVPDMLARSFETRTHGIA